MKIKECLNEIIRLLGGIDSKLGQENTGRPETSAMPSENTAEYRRIIDTQKRTLDEQAREIADLQRRLKTAQTTAAASGSEDRIKARLFEKIRPQIELQERINRDAQLAQAILGRHAAEDRMPQLIRLTAIVSQWNQVERIWDELKKRCDSAQRPATADELEILKACIDIHNLTYANAYNLAGLKNVERGTRFEMRSHTRATPRGDNIAAQWLPTLVNAGGIETRKAYVATE